MLRFVYAREGRDDVGYHITDIGRGSRRKAACDDARARRLVVNLGLHLATLIQDRLSHIALTARLQTKRFIGLDRKRRLETVRDVSRLRPRSLHELGRQGKHGVEIVDERLHFGRVAASLFSKFAPAASWAQSLTRRVTHLAQAMANVPALDLEQVSECCGDLGCLAR